MHELTQREDGIVEMFSGRGVVPWHGLGSVVEGLLTAEEAIKTAHLDWEVEQVPVQHLINEETQEYGVIPGKYCVRRKDNKYPLSVLSERYAPIQNQEAFTFFDKVVGEGQAYYETAGSLRGGKKIWIQASLPGKLFINNNEGDEIEKRVLFITSHDGSTALTGMIVPTRVVCSNTLNIALRNKSNQFKVYHRKNYMAKVEEASKSLQLINGYYNSLQDVINQLATIKVTKQEAEDFMEELFPSSRDEASTRTQNTRDAVIKLFRGGRGNVGESAWDLYNGVTEYVDHYQRSRMTSIRDNDTSTINPAGEARFERILTGYGATIKQRAFDLIAGNYNIALLN